MIKLDLKQADFLYDSEFLTVEESEELFYYFLHQNENYWEKRRIKMFGKTYESPRLERLCVENEGLEYAYSGQKLKSNLMSSEIRALLIKINELGYQFNAVLINYYRNGMDSNGWHADNEKELGADPIIASVSIGAKRKFKLQSKDKTEKFDLDLENGSLLIMGKGSQLNYKHQLPKMINLAEPRINLTFRELLK